MSEREEIEWLRELKAGNDGAYKVLFGKFYAPLCAFATGFVNDTAVAGGYRAGNLL